nr:hypothetical protein [Tanacetum cinerariifolium]
MFRHSPCTDVGSSGSKLPLNMNPMHESLSPVPMGIMEKKHSSACKRQQNLDSITPPLANVDECARIIEKEITNSTSTIRSNVYGQKNQSTKHLYAQDLKLSSQRRHISQKFVSKSICGQQHKVQTNDKQKCTLQKEYGERLDNNDAQVTSQVTVVPRIRHCDKSLAKCMYAETSNGQVPLGPNSKIFSTLSYSKD